MSGIDKAKDKGQELTGKAKPGSTVELGVRGGS